MRHLGVRISQPSGPVLGLASLLVVGLLIGLIVGWLWSRVEQEGVRKEDYLIMVSLLYERERSVPNALERLAVLQDSSVTRDLASLAKDYLDSHPEAQAEARALRQLSNALGESPTGAGSQQASSEGSSEGDSSGIWIWLGIALVLVCLIGVAGPIALGFLNSAHRHLSVPLRGGQRRKSFLFEGRSVKRPTVSPDAIRTLQRLQRLTARDSGESRQEAYSEVSSAEQPLEIRFSSRYGFGEDPFDEVHPVMDRSSGALIGACGFSAELKLSDNVPGRYYGFSVWAHDYFGGERLKCVGIVSKWAKSSAPPDLVRWAEAGNVGEVVVANPGMRLLIDTANLAVDVNISDFRYGTDGSAPPESYFSSLAVNFNVKVKDLVEG